jgi:hypothetical protein
MPVDMKLIGHQNIMMVVPRMPDTISTRLLPALTAGYLYVPNLGYQADSPWRIMLTSPIQTMTQTTLGDASGSEHHDGGSPDAGHDFHQITSGPNGRLSFAIDWHSE